MDSSFFLVFVIITAVAFGLLFFYFRKSKIDENQTAAIKDLERRMTDLMMGQSKDMNEQIRSFTQEATKIREDLKRVQDSVKDVSTFQDIFKSPKLRGQWGEASLEHILAQHFPQELYKMQYLFSTGEQVDAVLKLPNGKILPIDAKFPSENFEKMVNAGSETEKSFHKKNFIEDVKFKINDIAAKYILPAEGTLDYAFMYIPAEAVYYEIIHNIGREFDIAAFAWSKHIILTSPNGIYKDLRTIEHWFRDVQISKRTQEILKKLGRIHQDAGKLMDDFRRLGSHISNAKSAFDSSEKRLFILDDKVKKLEEIKDAKQLTSGD